MKKKHVPGELRYDCEDNENHFYMDFVDGELDELLFGDELEKSWTVIGFGDLKKGLERAGYLVDGVENKKKLLEERLSGLERELEEEKKASGYVEPSLDELKDKAREGFEEEQRRLNR